MDEFVHVLVVLVPVTVDAKDTSGLLVDADEVRRGAFFGLGDIVNLAVGVWYDVLNRELDHDALPVHVLCLQRLALDLVVGFLGPGLVRGGDNGNRVNVTVHAAPDTVIERELVEFLDVGLPGGTVVVRRTEWQDDLVHPCRLVYRPTTLHVLPQLGVLHSTHRHLGQDLLQLVPHARELLGHLPVHVAHLALGLRLLPVVRLADDLVLARATGRP